MNNTINSSDLKKKTLKSWLDHSKGFLNGAKYLGSPIVDVKVNPGFSSWFLLHLALESYLKAIILNSGKKLPKIHSLNELVGRTKSISDSVSKELERMVGNRTVEQWIKFIDPFGSPDGGVRYVSTKTNAYAAPVGIENFFDNLIKVIINECDLSKDITNLL